jgi:hypothetical protein
MKGEPEDCFARCRLQDRDSVHEPSQGQTKPGKIVTNARGGDSTRCHNYGLAADYVPDGQVEKPGIQLFG